MLVLTNLITRTAFRVTHPQHTPLSRHSRVGGNLGDACKNRFGYYLNTGEARQCGFPVLNNAYRHWQGMTKGRAGVAMER